MKKYFNYSVVAVILITLLGLFSCSKDDNAGGGSSKDDIEFYVDGNMMALDNKLPSYARHTTYTDVDVSHSGFEIWLNFTGGNNFVLNFNIENMNQVKKGDDITQYRHVYNDTKADLFYSSANYNTIWTKDLPGSATVDDINYSNQIIVIKLVDVKVKENLATLSNTTNYHILNATIKMHYDIVKTTLY